jgi:hypothetical protein
MHHKRDCIRAHFEERISNGSNLKYPVSTLGVILLKKNKNTRL